ncbi:unnamed protein product [Microthlaspi erraticum]|uniref:Uncharacterized protein n=1 Tax=Microthlaspi erraticum TaxID=1685480 RepID=A0A6D2KGU8_9BRAS|nr:unnamed protein product [Microthlaspi erraticum]
MFLSTNSTSSKIPRALIGHHVGTWSHKVHGEESIVVLLVHGELILLFLWLSLLHGSSWLLSCHFHQPLITSSPSSSLQIITFLFQVHPNLKLSLLTLTTNGVIPLLGPPFFPQSLTLRLLRVHIPLHQTSIL